MNIFEALEKGNGKATIAGNLNLYYVVYENGRFHARSIGLPVWLLPQEVPYSALQHNDWIPYVPRETYSSCGQAMPSPKVKHKEVFEDTTFYLDSDSNVLVLTASGSELKRICKLPKKGMKVTLEWEE